MSVLSVVKVRMSAGKSAEILNQVADVLQGESVTQAGFVAGEILVSHDRTIVVIITEWSDSHAWSRSRYDARVGKMLEDCLAASSQIEFEMYDRHARFSANLGASDAGD